VLVSAYVKPALCGLFLLSSVARAQDAVHDFDTLWRTVQERYAYFDDAGIAARWDCVRDKLRPRVAAADNASVLPLLEEAIESLTDFHAHLNTNNARSWRLVPSGADLRAALNSDGTANITHVRARTPAKRMGVRAGDEIVSINGVNVTEAIRAHLPVCVSAANPAVQNWALQRLISGKRDAPRALALRQADGRERTLYLPAPAVEKTRTAIKKLAGGVVVIPITGLGDSGSVKRFNAQLARNADARALILDLRETADGGNTDIAEPILGRFITSSAAYQRVLPRGEAAYDRIVQPSALVTIKQPVAVVVGPWTASMGEGLAIGLNALRAAPVVGGPMAGLRGAVETFTLPVSGWRFSIPTQKLSHVNGTPREEFAPTVAPKNDYGTDLVFNEALRALALPAKRAE
jgi:C-terminal processing protease CtpA/Prc